MTKLVLLTDSHFYGTRLPGLVEVPADLDLTAAFAAFHDKYGFPPAPLFDRRRGRNERFDWSAGFDATTFDRWLDAVHAAMDPVRDRCIADGVLPENRRRWGWHDTPQDYLLAFAGYLTKYHGAKVVNYTTFGYEGAD